MHVHVHLNGVRLRQEGVQAPAADDMVVDGVSMVRLRNAMTQSDAASDKGSTVALGEEQAEG